jgi:peroxiredoxin
MDSFYRLLDVDQKASPEDIEAAYRRQIERYSPERVADLDPELRMLAEQRTQQIEEAYATLSNPASRAAYDGRLAAPVAALGQAQRPGVTRREVVMSAGGAMVGLALIAVVWFFAGRTAEPTLPPVGEMTRVAPAFSLPSLDGGTVNLSDYRGKVVLVNFWGTWCEPCKEETPALQQAYTQLQSEGLEIIGVNLYSQETGGEEAVRAFLQPYGVTYPIALDTAGDIARSFQISPIPVSYFVDQNGTIRYVKVGTLREAEVRALFERLRAEASVAQP